MVGQPVSTGVVVMAADITTVTALSGMVEVGLGHTILLLETLSGEGGLAVGLFIPQEETVECQ